GYSQDVTRRWEFALFCGQRSSTQTFTGSYYSVAESEDNRTNTWQCSSPCVFNESYRYGRTEQLGSPGYVTESDFTGWKWVTSTLSISAVHSIGGCANGWATSTNTTTGTSGITLDPPGSPIDSATTRTHAAWGPGSLPYGGGTDDRQDEYTDAMMWSN